MNSITDRWHDDYDMIKRTRVDHEQVNFTTASVAISSTSFCYWDGLRHRRFIYRTCNIVRLNMKINGYLFFVWRRWCTFVYPHTLIGWYKQTIVRFDWILLSTVTWLFVCGKFKSSGFTMLCFLQSLGWRLKHCRVSRLAHCVAFDMFHFRQLGK